MAYLDLPGLGYYNQKIQQQIQALAGSKGGMPIGFEYFQTNPVIRAGSLPLTGGEYSRKLYKDLWEWVQTQSGYLISEAEWQVKSKASNGAVPFYSDGDGSTTFRVPALTVWIKGQGANEAIGDYLSDSFKGHKHNVSAKSSSAGSHTHTATSSEVADHTHTGSTGSAGGVTPKGTVTSSETSTYSGTASSNGGHGHTASTNNVGGHTHTRGTMNITGHVGQGHKSNGSINGGWHNHNNSGYGGGALYLEGTGYGSSCTWSGYGDAGIIRFDAARNWTGATSNSGSHTHSVTVDSSGAHTHTVDIEVPGHTHTLSVEPIPAHTHSVSISNAGRHSHKIDVTSSVDHTHTVTVTETEQGSSETKPRTIVGVYCVIAFGTVTSSGSVDLNSVQEVLKETQKIFIESQKGSLDYSVFGNIRERDPSKPNYGIT